MTTPAAPAHDLPRPFDSTHFSDPHTTYRRLREQAPVHRIALPDGSPVWLILRERDVRASLSNPRLSVDKAHASTGYKGFDLPKALDANLLNLDGDDHLRLRRLVSKAFTPRHVDSLRERIRTYADRLADTLARQLTSQEEADLVAEFAAPLPLMVICDLLDVPEADRKAFSTWVTHMLEPTSRQQLAEAIQQIHQFFTRLVTDRRAALGDDLLSALITARDEDDKLTEDELVSLAFLILMAGSENTQHLISAGLLTLLNHPEQLATLRASPRLLPHTIEELLRYAHPNHTAIRRFATEPLTLAGTTIPAGDTVLLSLAAAHRDPDRYPDPDRFDIHRADTAHLALGHGMHYCLGAPLARAQVDIALTTLLHRFPHLSPAIPAEQLSWRTTFRFHALKHLPLTTQS
ncbi:cytochrome P450 [Streptomyces sp. NPDC087300]|uniref:cytochrome P450 family protein n=1 Tax=Streptomyces sp. NPDC087300 TaxID=3365780 RepID=UPI0037FF3D8F